MKKPERFWPSALEMSDHAGPPPHPTERAQPAPAAQHKRLASCGLRFGCANAWGLRCRYKRTRRSGRSRPCRQLHNPLAKSQMLACVAVFRRALSQSTAPTHMERAKREAEDALSRTYHREHLRLRMEPWSDREKHEYDPEDPGSWSRSIAICELCEEYNDCLDAVYREVLWATEAIGALEARTTLPVELAEKVVESAVVNP